MPPKQKTNRSASGTPKSSTFFNLKQRTPSLRGRRGRSCSMYSRKSSQTASALRRRLISLSQNSLSNSRDSKRSYKSQSSRCTKGENCEFDHYHIKFFQKTRNFITKGKAQIINQQYQNQIKEGRVLVEVKQLKFLSWNKVQQLARNLTQSVLEQAVSIATINKNAEHDEKKELKQLKQTDDDPTHILDLKIEAYQIYYDKLIKTGTKSDADKKNQRNKTSHKNQKNDQKSNSNLNQNQPDQMDIEYMKEKEKIIKLKSQIKIPPLQQQQQYHKQKLYGG